MEINDKLILSNNFIINAVSLTGAITLPLYAILLLLNKEYSSNLNNINKKLGVDSASIYSIPGAISYTLNYIFKNKFLAATASLITGLSLAKDTWEYRYLIKDHLTYKDCIYKKLIGFSQHLKSSLNLLYLFEKKKNFKRWLNSQNLSLNKIKERITIFEKKLTNLNSTFFNTGHTYSIYKFIYENKEKYIDLMILIGQLDGFIATALIFNETQNFCLPKFLNHEVDNHPFIDLQKFINPILPTENSVSNSIILGRGNLKNILVTGPNTGGKTTICAKGIPLNVVLAQSIGIARAKSMTLTPFCKIRTSIKINDNTSSGKSLFQAGAERIKDLLFTISQLKYEEKCLISIDEILGGTSCNENAAAAYSLLEELGKIPNIICIATSHYPLLTKLKSESGLFENYKVEIDYNQNQIIRNYKLILGASGQNSAFNVLHEIGFSDMFLKRAQEILAKLINKKDET